MTSAPPPHELGHAHGVPSDVEARVLAIESLLVEKGLIESTDVDRIVRRYEDDIGPLMGARVVARAWTDPSFKTRLLADGTAAIAELGIESHDLHLEVVENRPGVHHLVVCTLCSCYPWFLLGLPPTWYKSAAYRSRAVIEPRTVLQEFGVQLPDDTRIVVHDSSAELRYLVLPERPPGTDGWDAERLAALVTRESMIGTGLPSMPAEVRGVTE
ncbi:MAG: nitrile hydratase subunit alpha [Candidatus Dormibacteraeota bacterium]|nr:nitrile hydratase subunit alpha [Candidatus Dormibacteraeota bacterium]MBO0746326.1 nitrile hydratase subunit alpha [Candidatus Dormibacteraeota bacterium]